MIEIHSDDYGLFPKQSKRIADCIRNGALNGISIMPNSPYLDECMMYIKDLDVLYTIHLNLVLGKRLSRINSNELISKDGILNCSFGKLLLVSYIPFVRKKYFNEIKNELLAQIENTKKYFKNDVLRIDSHRHYHMLPIVFDALMSVIKENHFSVSYIRIPTEQLSRYRRLSTETTPVRPINWVKVLILNLLSSRNTDKYRSYLSGLESKTYSGIVYSGNMSIKNSHPIVMDAIRHNENIEIAFHPGGVFESSDLKELMDEPEAKFQSSDNRNLEAEAIKALRGVL